MAARLSRIIPVSLTLLAAMALSACTSQQAPALKEGEKPVDVASVVRQKMPASVKDREAWAQAIATAFDSQKLAPTEENVCSVLAVGVAVGIYFALQPYVGTEEIGWMCILGAAPFAACGFFTYHGMTAEQVLWAWFKSEILCPKRLVFKSDSYYYEAMQPAIRAGIKRKKGLPMKKNTHDSEETA